MSSDRKLPGNSRTFSFGYPEELWLRDDHLLCVSMTTVYENYQRFYYRDIESIVVSPTRTFLVLNLCFAVLPLLALIFYLAVEPDRSLWSLVLVWLVLTLINVLKGPTCKTVLRTRINTRTLSSLRRRRTARKALALLNARIVDAQNSEPVMPDARPAASEPPDQLAPTPEPGAAAPGLAPPPLNPTLQPAAPGLTQPPPLPPAAPITLTWHHVSTLLVILQGVLAINAALYPHWGLAAALIGMMLFTSLACVPALISQRRQSLPPGLRKASWWLTAFQFISAYPLLIGGGAVLSARAQTDANLAPLATAYADALVQYDALKAAFVLFAAISFALVIWQALAMRSVKRT